jgi:hypothetical protein
MFAYDSGRRLFEIIDRQMAERLIEHLATPDD